GYIGNEEEIFDIIAEDIGDARLFSLGVGSSVNRHLLDGMARSGRGSVTYVDLEQPTEPVVDRIYDKLRSPALIDLRVDIDGLDAHDVVPGAGALPDLFVGEPVVLFGRYEGDLGGTITVHGRRRGEQVAIDVDLRVARDEDTDGVRSMWARAHIDALTYDHTLAWASQARRDRVTQEVIGLSLRHRVLTQHTAFVAVDRQRTVDGRSRGKTVVQGVQAPRGIAHESVWGHVGPPPGMGNTSSSTSGLGAGGTGSGYGRGSGAGFGGRGKRVPRVRVAKAKIAGSLDRFVIKRIVRAHIGEVRRCYNAGLVNDPTLTGRVVVSFVIGRGGRVVSSAVDSDASTLSDRTVSNCIAKVVKGWKFPRTEGDANALVHYPFVLQPS
nr:AgmX/PglI C-terminal domain-containing protein [Deltaproteobacteria bacterium]